MTRQEHLVPKPGLRVLDPDTLIRLPAEGAPVVMTSYWYRRIADGDVTVQEPAAKATKPAAKPTAKAAAKE